MGSVEPYTGPRAEIPYDELEEVREADPEVEDFEYIPESPFDTLSAAAFSLTSLYYGMEAYQAFSNGDEVSTVGGLAATSALALLFAGVFWDFSRINDELSG